LTKALDPLVSSRGEGRRKDNGTNASGNTGSSRQQKSSKSAVSIVVNHNLNSSINGSSSSSELKFALMFLRNVMDRENMRELTLVQRVALAGLEVKVNNFVSRIVIEGKERRRAATTGLLQTTQEEHMQQLDNSLHFPSSFDCRACGTKPREMTSAVVLTNSDIYLLHVAWKQHLETRSVTRSANILAPGIMAKLSELGEPDESLNVSPYSKDAHIIDIAIVLSGAGGVKVKKSDDNRICDVGISDNDNASDSDTNEEYDVENSREVESLTNSLEEANWVLARAKSMIQGIFSTGGEQLSQSQLQSSASSIAQENDVFELKAMLSEMERKKEGIALILQEKRRMEAAIDLCRLYDASLKIELGVIFCGPGKAIGKGGSVENDIAAKRVETLCLQEQEIENQMDFRYSGSKSSSSRNNRGRTATATSAEDDMRFSNGSNNSENEHKSSSRNNANNAKSNVVVDQYEIRRGMNQIYYSGNNYGNSNYHHEELNKSSAGSSSRSALVLAAEKKKGKMVGNSSLGLQENVSSPLATLLATVFSPLNLE
jgi:hypothetical protein